MNDLLSAKVKIESTVNYSKSSLESMCLCRANSTTATTTTTAAPATTSTTGLDNQATTTTVLPGITDICQNVSHIFNLTTGTYIKSICYYSVSHSYPDVFKFALSKNMYLFASTSKEEYAAAINFHIALFQKFTLTLIRINGNYTEKGGWMAYNPNAKLIVPQVASIANADCLHFRGNVTAGIYQMIPFNCAEKIHSFFEYFASPIPVNPVPAAVTSTTVAVNTTTTTSLAANATTTTAASKNG